MATTRDAKAQQYVYVQPVVAQPNTHTGGFYGRLQLGVGYSYSVSPDPVGDLSWYGGGFDYSISLGLSLPSSIALHFDLLGDFVWEPTVALDGEELGTATDTSYSTTGFGGGITRYFPRNGFVTAGLGFAIANLTTDSTSTDSDLGGYATFGGGREWWLAPRFGLGVYGRLTIFRVTDDTDASITTIVPSAGLSMSID